MVFNKPFSFSNFQELLQARTLDWTCEAGYTWEEWIQTEGFLMMWMYRVDSTDVLRRSVIKRETQWNGFENKSCISVNSFCDSKNNRYEEKQHFVRFAQYLHKSPELIIMGYTKKKFV